MELTKRVRDGDTVLVEMGMQRLEMTVLCDRRNSTKLVFRYGETVKLSVLRTRRFRPRGISDIDG